MRRSLFFLIVAFATATSCKHTSQQKEIYLFSYFINNGEDGKSFLAPNIGNDKLMRDPCIIEGPDKLFHMVWTTGWWDKHIGYANSKDLITWSDQTLIPVMEHEPDAKNSWAPELFYDPETENYIIHWATTIPDRHSEVAESEREKGLNHRIYCTATKDFKNFTPTAIFFNPDFSVIDANILLKNKTYYMFLKNENPNPPEKNIRISTSLNALGPYPTSVSQPITGKYWAEGPTSIQIGDYVYVYFDKYNEGKYGAVRSKDMITWEDISHKISFPQGIRHGSVFKAQQKNIDNILNNPTLQ